MKVWIKKLNKKFIKLWNRKFCTKTEIEIALKAIVKHDVSLNPKSLFISMLIKPQLYPNESIHQNTNHLTISMSTWRNNEKTRKKKVFNVNENKSWKLKSKCIIKTKHKSKGEKLFIVSSKLNDLYQSPFFLSIEFDGVNFNEHPLTWEMVE